VSLCWFCFSFFCVLVEVFPPLTIGTPAILRSSASQAELRSFRIPLACLSARSLLSSVRGKPLFFGLCIVALQSTRLEIENIGRGIIRIRRTNKMSKQSETA
jgi:hypothetical protein